VKCCAVKPCEYAALNTGYLVGSLTVSANCVHTVGEANSGKASKSVATYTSGIGQVQDSSSSAMSEIGQAKRVGKHCVDFVFIF